MNIVLLTNTFTPHVGGVARSVQAFAEEYRRRGHRVLVVAPEFPKTPQNETDILRVPAIQNFNASDFSVALPFSTHLKETLDAFHPDVIHSQHPFLLGMTAVRIVRQRKLPLVFTHHTLYEQYTHYVPGDSPALKRFVVELATRYANLCNQVFAPSESIRDLLLERGVKSPVAVIPTGVRIEKFANGDGRAFRAQRGIPQDATVVGHMGRLAPEKNLEFLAEAVSAFIKSNSQAHFLVVGRGPSEKIIREVFSRKELEAHLHFDGILAPDQLADALNAMDLFAFASKSETQGMVLTEAMAAGLPIVALDAPGVREVVKDQENGRMIHEETEAAFSSALQWVVSRSPDQMRDLKQAARKTAEDFSLARTADQALALYESLKAEEHSKEEEQGWHQIIALIKAEWDIMKSVAQAGEEALHENWFFEDDER